MMLQRMKKVNRRLIDSSSIFIHALATHLVTGVRLLKVRKQEIYVGR